MKKQKELPFKISQSFMNDAFHTESDMLKDMIRPNFCPKYLYFKYVEGKQTPPTPAMQLGNYFEWHLLGATRSGEEPILPRIGIKDQRPTKSASFPVMAEYLTSKDFDFSQVTATGRRKDNKPPKSAAKGVLEAYITSKGGTLPEGKYNTTDLYNQICGMPEDLGEPVLTCEDLFAAIQTLPADWTEGEISTQQKKMDQVILLAKTILEHLGLETSKGEKQIRVSTEDKSGHFDWITANIEDLQNIAIYDVKFTQTKEDDWRNGWANISEREDAKTQASHYAAIYYEKFGKWLPFYFLIFGEDGWIQIIKMVMTEVGYSVYKVSVDRAKELLQGFVVSDWKARPEFNRCLKCPFSEECPDRAVLPEVTEFFL